jgi:DNA-binding LacI/PurR family transcriptional regulator
MTPPTIRDVARHAGVGIGTVSRVINNSERVSPETRQRVQEAIRLLGFRPNKTASQLSRGMQIRNVGVILPFLTFHAFTERLRGVQIVLNEANYELVLYNISSPERFDEQLVEICQNKLVEGLLIIALNLTPAQHTLLEDAAIKYVCINDHCQPGIACIGPDNVVGGRVATEHLLGLGHHKIAYVGDSFPDNYGFLTSYDRYTGYYETMLAHGVLPRPEYIRLGEHGKDVARLLTTELLNLSDPPTAIFAMSDIQALGCLAAIREAGRHVPNDISVIGFDDIEISSYVGLTTVRQFLEESGRLAMRWLLWLLNDSHIGTPLQLPLPELVVRETTRRLP